jgi:hypothetical protein
MSSKTTGSKLDGGKEPITLVPAEAILGMAKAMQYGAKKYGSHNFKGGIAHSRLVDACFRHLLALVRGEDTDIESGLPHTYHAAASIGMLIWMQENRADLDDRWKKETDRTIAIRPSQLTKEDFELLKELEAEDEKARKDMEEEFNNFGGPPK